MLQEIEIHCKVINKSDGMETFPLSVKVSDTILNVKHKIQEMKGLQADLFEVVFQQKKMDPHFTVSAFYLKDQDTVYIVPYIK